MHPFLWGMGSHRLKQLKFRATSYPTPSKPTNFLKARLIGPYRASLAREGNQGVSCEPRCQFQKKGGFWRTGQPLIPKPWNELMLWNRTELWPRASLRAFHVPGVDQHFFDQGAAWVAPTLGSEPKPKVSCLWRAFCATPKRHPQKKHMLQWYRVNTLSRSRRSSNYLAQTLSARRGIHDSLTHVQTPNLVNFCGLVEKVNETTSTKLPGGA